MPPTWRSMPQMPPSQQPSIDERRHGRRLRGHGCHRSMAQLLLTCRTPQWWVKGCQLAALCVLRHQPVRNCGQKRAAVKLVNRLLERQFVNRCDITGPACSWHRTACMMRCQAGGDTACLAAMLDGLAWCGCRTLPVQIGLQPRRLQHTPARQSEQRSVWRLKQALRLCLSTADIDSRKQWSALSSPPACCRQQEQQRARHRQQPPAAAVQPSLTPVLHSRRQHSFT